MFEMLGVLIWIIFTGAAGVGGYVFMKRFVQRRLRFVDGVHRPWVPFAAGAGAALLAAPVAGVLPFLGGGSAALFGLGVGLGVSAGRRELKRLPGA